MNPYPKNPAKTDAPIIEVIQNRWSPITFSDEVIDDKMVAQLFEAARWAQSSYNEQPWRYIYAQKKDAGRAKLESLLVEGNAWAKNGGILLISFCKKNFTYNNKPDYYHLHDTGAASAFLTLQATHMGLVTHQMEGFARDKANALLGVPDEYTVGSMMAIGWPGDASKRSDDVKKREDAPRSRKLVAEFAFKNEWQK